MNDLALFGDEPSSLPQREAEKPLPDHLVTQLRGQLDALGVTTMDARRALIEELAHREVPSLRHLRFEEAKIIGERLKAKQQPADGRPTGSSWDNRDENTWIDRM